MSQTHDSNDVSTGEAGDGDSKVKHFDDEALVQSIVDAIPSDDRKSLNLELRSFVDRHSCHHRPIALVSSGGTAADLEVNSVRCLDNFSTGKRGAISVEEFLKRGYAVIHLWRKGSASPYGRVLSKLIMGKNSMPNEGISLASLGKLFSTGESGEDTDVHDAENINDPWLSDPPMTVGEDHAINQTRSSRSNNRSLYKGSVQLHRRITNSTSLHTALTERQSAIDEGRILTVPFRSVEEYLAKLQMASISLRDSQSLAIFYLAAAVSDFYVPLAERSPHKIQSRDIPEDNSDSVLTKESGNSCLSLKLWPVPKVMGLLRYKWAPDAFICSFKLETDKSILRQKAESAVKKYGCHMVIGNLLKTRHDQVWVLAPDHMMDWSDESSSDNLSSTVKDWPMKEITRPKSSESEVLEGLIIERVCQTHFEYISTSMSGSLDKSGAASVMRAHSELQQKKKILRREIFWNQVQKIALDWAGVFAGAALSYAISTALRRRMDA